MLSERWNLAQNDKNECWFAVHVKSKCESKAAVNLSSRNVEIYLPTYTTSRKWSDRTKQIELPLFPGYVFARFDPNQWLPVSSAPGVARIVSFGGRPAPVEQEEVDAIRRVVEAGLDHQPFLVPAVGETVRIENGPLRGTEGVVINNGAAGRKFVVSVQLLQRAVAVELDPSWAVRTASATAAAALS